MIIIPVIQTLYDYQPYPGMISGTVNGDTATRAVLEAAKAVAGENFSDAKFDKK